MTLDEAVACSNCGALFDSDAGKALCPKPSAGKPLVDCGRGGHMFDRPVRSGISRYGLIDSAWFELRKRLGNAALHANGTGSIAEHDLLQIALTQLDEVRPTVERARAARSGKEQG